MAPSQLALFKGRPAWAEINLERLRHNYDRIRKAVPPSVRLMPVVKADGYGHGAAVVARELAAHGSDCFAVATAEEGAELRSGGIKGGILILGVTTPAMAEHVVRYSLTPTVCSPEFAEALNAASMAAGRRSPVHIRLDIGLGSIGVHPKDALAMARRVDELPGLRIEGIYMQLASAYREDDAQVRKDLQSLRELRGILEASGLPVPLLHAASSPAIIGYPEAAMDLVRPGIMLYGLPGLRGDTGLERSLKPVMQLKASIVFVKRLETGSPIGYGTQHVTDSPVRIATIPIGYGDGMFLYFLTGGEVLIRGRRAPIFGKVFMDHMMIDVSHIPDAAPGDEAVLFGEQDGQVISAVEVAERARIGGFNSDAVHLLGRRIPRIYTNGSAEEVQHVDS